MPAQQKTGQGAQRMVMASPLLALGALGMPQKEQLRGIPTGTEGGGGGTGANQEVLRVHLLYCW